MGAVLQELLAHGRRLLDAVRAETADHMLARLLDTHGELLDRLGSARAAGEPLDAAEVAELRALDRALMAALEQRRDAIALQLAALRRGRAAGTAYGGPGAAAARFVDRSG